MGTSLVLDLLELLVSELHELQQGSQPSASARLPAFPATVSNMVQEKWLSAVKAMLQHWIEVLKTGNFEARLSDIKQALMKLPGQLGLLIEREMQNGITLQLFDSQASFQKNFACPTMAFLQRWSTTPKRPGEILETKLLATESQILDLEAKVSRMAAALVASSGQSSVGPGVGVGNTNPFSWGHGGPTLSTQFSAAPVRSPAGPGTSSASAGVGGVDIVVLAEQVPHLKDDVDSLKDQMEAQVVEIATEVFKSKTDGATWLATQNAKAHVYLFVDAISFLLLCTCNDHESETKAANQRATTVKVKDQNTYQMAFIDSYLLEVPPLLGKGVNANATRATRTLAAVPMLEAFYPGGGKEGVRECLVYYVKDGFKTLDTLLGDTFNQSSPAFIVARFMLTSSYAFWDEFCRWIINYHDKRLGKSNASLREIWSLVSHCVRAVFKSIRSAQATGQAFHSPEGMFWGSLQAHRVMGEYKDADLSGHPKIALILHEHLINFSTPLSKFEEFQEKLRKEMKELVDHVEKAQRSANQANAAANSKKGAAASPSNANKKE
ncbi:hypothetical protein ACA910_013124 [Epithemia clementina (nom. ined.)]